MAGGFEPRPLRTGRPLALIAILFVAFFVLDMVVRLSVEVLWFSELQALGVLTTRWTWKSLLGIAGFAVAWAALATNVLLALRRSPRVRIAARGQTLSIVSVPRRLVLLGTAAVAVLFAMTLAERWLEVRLLWARAPYGRTDPIFGRDLSDYLFVLPVWNLLVGWALGLVAACLAGTAFVDFGRGAIGPVSVNTRAFRHLAVLGGIFLVLLAGRFALAQYELLHAQHGVLFGASYADVHARLPGLRILAVASLVAAGLVVAGAFRGRWKWMVGGPLGLVILAIVCVGVWPAIVQKLVVEPNELQKETPYIENTIALTREAYDLESIEPHHFDIDRELDAATLTQQRDLVDNIRLWDWRPLLSTYGQIQEIRLYYNFGDVDIDRYVLNGRYRQVMLSARELAYDQIPAGARTWVNLHLKYTHGYGLCMSPVNQITSEGLPELYIRDIPPQSNVDVQITRPEIYYGEQTSIFALVGMSTDEFDYPVGDTNQATRYTGKGGIAAGSFGRRLLFAWYLRSRELLLTGYVTPESRILMRRSLRERIPRVAPFLLYDQDPYVVVHDGRLVWIQDAYTHTDRFPYAQAVGRLNYVRNAVKVVVDAYDGTTTFYAMDPNEPLLRAYTQVFPGLFRPLDEMPAGLRAHLRYPEDLFRIQAEVFATFHMEDPQVFYNREDLWQLPIESVGGQETLVEPYYAVLRLPDSERPELLLMLPFTPARKDNMMAWLAARCDGAGLGERMVFLFPKQELVYGPRQIEARIDQDASISQMLTLWSQRGSNVIRGNLLVIPIERSILYVEPLYLQAAKGALPELKRVIIAHGDRIEMGPDLETTLSMLFGPSEMANEEPAVETPESRRRPSTAGGTEGSAALTLGLLRRAETAVQRGDWVAYGNAMQELRRALESAAALESSGGTPP